MCSCPCLLSTAVIEQNIDFSRQLLDHETLGSCDSPLPMKRRRLTSQKFADCSSQSLSLQKLWRLKEKEGVDESQLIIDAGQKHFGAVTCGTCGMVFSSVGGAESGDGAQASQLSGDGARVSLAVVGVSVCQWGSRVSLEAVRRGRVERQSSSQS